MEEGFIPCVSCTRGFHIKISKMMNKYNKLLFYYKLNGPPIKVKDGIISIDREREELTKLKKQKIIDLDIEIRKLIEEMNCKRWRE